MTVANVNRFYSSHFSDAFPREIKTGVYGATFYQGNTPLYLRMELLTKENQESWTWYKLYSSIFSVNVSHLISIQLGDSKNTGFSEQDLVIFKTLTKGKDKEQLETMRHVFESMHRFSFPEMYTEPESTHSLPLANEQRYITYATTNREFSIQTAYEKTDQTQSLENYIDAYKDLLITVGSDFTQENSFSNRGFCRSPYRTLLEEFGGLSMVVLGFNAKVSQTFFPAKSLMGVRPLYAMQSIIKKSLLQGEGVVLLPKNECQENADGSITHTRKNRYYDSVYQTVDIKRVEMSPSNNGEYQNWINISALCRIYFDKLDCHPKTFSEDYRHPAIGCLIA